MSIRFARGRASVCSSFLFVIFGSAIAFIGMPAFASVDAPKLSVNGNYTVSWNAQHSYQAYELDGASVTKTGSKSFSNRSDGNYTHVLKGCSFGSRGSKSCRAIGNGKVTVKVERTTSKPIGVPVLDLPSQSATSEYRLYWIESEHAEYYEWSKKKNSGSWSSNTRSNKTYIDFDDTNATYEYRLRACNANGCTAFSSSETIIVDEPPATPPAKVGTLTLPLTSHSGQYVLSWQEVRYTDRYEWSRRVNNGSWNSPAAVQSASVSFDSSAGSYQYRVRACNSFGCGSYSNTKTISVVAQGAQSAFDYNLNDTSILPNLPQGLDVAITAGSSSISQGNLSYRVPIQTPPAVNGLKPSISLYYNSINRKSGLAGLGWNVSGLGAITRCKASFSNEGTQAQKSNPMYSKGDRLCLNGIKLELINNSGNANNNAYWAPGAEYRTEIDSFRKIKAIGGHQGGPSYFKVWTKGGSIQYYGTNSHGQNSQIFATNRHNGPISSWQLSKVEDRYSNAYTVHYIRNTSTGEFYPDFIFYEPGAAIVFKYKEREKDVDLPDIPSRYDSGHLASTHKILDRIETYVQSTRVRPWAGLKVFEYKLTHTRSRNTGRYLVDSVQHCGFEPTRKVCAKPLGFEWSKGSLAFSEGISEFKTCSGENIRIHKPNHILHLPFFMDDLDQDGLNDLVGPSWVHWGTKTGCFIKSNISVGNPNLTASQRVINTPEGKALFFQTIGYGFHPERRATIELTSSVVKAVLFKGRQATTIKLDEYHLPGENLQVGVRALVPKLHVADFNNDGLEDIEFHGRRRLQMNNGKFEFGPVINTSRTDQDLRDSYSYNDIDSDGLADIFSEKTNLSDVTPGNFKPKKRADFNGDGLLDEVLYVRRTEVDGSTYSGSKIFLNTGKQLVETDAGGSSFYDFNRDGKTDVGGGTRVKLAQYGGDGLDFVGVSVSSIHDDNILAEDFRSQQAKSLDREIHSGLPDKDTSILGDVNNDGIADTYSRYADRAAQDMLVGVTDGFGREERFEFDTLHSDDSHGKMFYTPAPVAFPFVQADRKRYVVKSHQASDGLGSYAPRYYHYYGAKRHLQGRGFAGFAKIEITYVEQGLLTTNEYLQHFPYIGRMKSSITKATNGKLISRTENAYKTHSQNNRFVYLASQYSQSFGLTTSSTSSDLSTVATRYSYDQYGNAIQSVSQQGHGRVWNGLAKRWQVSDIAKTTTINMQYTNNASAYLIGFMTRSETINTLSGGESKTMVHKFEAQPNTKDVKVIRQYADTKLEKHTTTNRNALGVVTSVSEKAKQPNGTWTSNRTATSSNFEKTIYPREIKNAKNHKIQLKYDARFGVVRESTDPNGLKSLTQFDAFGRTVKETDQASGTSGRMFSFYCADAQIFCPEGAVSGSGTVVENSNIGDALGAPLTITFYDKLKRTLRTQSYTLGGVVKVDTEYDTAGRVKRTSLPFTGSSADNWTEYSGYDALGRTLRVDNPDGSSQTVSYSQSSGELVTTNENNVVSENGNSTQTNKTYENNLGQTRRVVDAHNTPVDYTYDAQGNLNTTTVDGSSATRVSITHDIAGNKTFMRDPDVGPISFYYNGFGELLTQLWREGTTDQKSMAFTYDNLGRLTNREDRRLATGSVKQNQWTWDSRKLGLLTKKTSNNGFGEDYFYDTQSRLQRSETSLSGLSKRTFTYGYDAYGREKTVIYPDGLKIRRDYHALGINTATFDTTGRSVATTNPAHLIWQLDLELDQLGNLTSKRFGNGVVSEYKFDQKTGRVTRIYSGKGARGNIQSLGYSYDSNGNLRSRVSSRTHIQGWSIENRFEHFQYDGLNRLINADPRGAWGQWGDDQSPCGNNFCYDDLGNLSYKSDKGVFKYQRTGNAGIHAITQGDGNSYQYDKYGNVSKKGSTVIEHDVFNKPTKIGHVSFAYGPDHIRFKQVNSEFGYTTYYFNGGAYEESSNGIKRSTVDGVLVRETKSGSVTKSFLLTDNQGSVETITDSAGNILDRLDFSPWGERATGNWRVDDPTMGMPFMFKVNRGYTGHEHLDDLGLIHMNGRVYDPSVSRFLEADIYIQAPYNTQSYNRYTYVFNNPLAYTDPTGYRGSSMSGTTSSGPQPKMDNIPEIPVYPPLPLPPLTGMEKANKHGLEAAIQRLLYQQNAQGYFLDHNGERQVLTFNGEAISGNNFENFVYALAGKDRTSNSIAAGPGTLEGPVGGTSLLDDILKVGLSRLNLLLAVGALPGSTPRMHRGRIQAQGGGLEASVPWSQAKPPTTAQGLAMLNALKTQLTAKQVKERSFGFARAEKFIINAGKAGGVSAPVSRTFLTPGEKHIRVDIEVITGTAFVPQ